MTIIEGLVDLTLAIIAGYAAWAVVGVVFPH